MEIKKQRKRLRDRREKAGPGAIKKPAMKAGLGDTYRADQGER